MAKASMNLDRGLNIPVGEAEIVRDLDGDITFCRLAPATRLIEHPLGVRFGVGRHFVGQALSHLERMGIAVRKRNSSATSRSLTPEQLHHFPTASRENRSS